MKIKFIDLCFVDIAIILFFFGICAADYTELIQTVEQSLKGKWEIEAIKENIKPYWSLSEATCTEIVLVGPKKTGYRFLDKNKVLIMEHLSHRESIILWITDKNFDSGWNILEIIKNRFKLFPIKRPSLLYDGVFKVFGAESFFVFDTTYSITSPPGTLSAIGMGIKRSWPDWKKDFFKNFQKSPTKRLSRPGATERLTKVSALTYKL